MSSSYQIDFPMQVLRHQPTRGSSTHPGMQFLGNLPAKEAGTRTASPQKYKAEGCPYTLMTPVTAQNYHIPSVVCITWAMCLSPLVTSRRDPSLPLGPICLLCVVLWLALFRDSISSVHHRLQPSSPPPPRGDHRGPSISSRTRKKCTLRF